MLWKVGLKEQRERKNKSKVTQDLVERKGKKKENYSRIKNKKRKELLTQMKKEGKQKGERIGETGRDKVIESGRFSRYVKEGKKSLKYT